jgi:hypothetical protein
MSSILIDKNKHILIKKALFGVLFVVYIHFIVIFDKKTN